jgi:ABC-type sugar transport system ATPase subunit
MTGGGHAAGETPPLLELRDVGKDYGSVIALDGITTTVRAGEVTCVLGDNGAGKSTLIKILSGVHRADRATCCSTGSRWRSERRGRRSMRGSRRSTRTSRRSR